MRLFYRVHGKHCHLRSFPTKCKECGAEVLYWECTHGSKLFFNYPVYGKLIKHRCLKDKNKKSRNKYPILVKSPMDLFTQNSFSCPACGKFFKNKNDMSTHFKQSKKFDNLHKNFYENELVYNKNFSKITSEQKQEAKINYKAKFGQINIKK